MLESCKEYLKESSKEYICIISVLSPEMNSWNNLGSKFCRNSEFVPGEILGGITLEIIGKTPKGTLWEIQHGDPREYPQGVTAAIWEKNPGLRKILEESQRNSIKHPWY